MTGAPETDRLAALERRVAELAAREAIRDVLLRYCAAADRCDAALMRSCFFDDAIDEHGFFNGSAIEFAGLAARNLGERFQATKHFLTNARIQLSGDRAACESYVLAVLRGERNGVLADVTFSARYLDRFERRGGEWRIAHRLLISDGTRVDAVIEQEFHMDQAARGARGADDPSHAWFGHN